MRGGFIGLVIGTLTGVIFAILTSSLRPLLLIPIDIGFGLLLGSIVGLVIRLLNAGRERQVNKIITGAIYGMMIGAIILMPFSEGFFMAAYVTVEGAIIGGLVGTVVGALLRGRQPSANRRANM